MLTYRGTTYPWQCDHMGHVNVMWYVSKFDEATWPFFAAMGLTPSYLRGRHAMAAVQQNISYKAELLAGDIIEIRSRVLEVRDKVIRYVHELYRIEPGALSAVCELTTVHFDRETRRSCPLPPEVAAGAKRLMIEGG